MAQNYQVVCKIKSSPAQACVGLSHFSGLCWIPLSVCTSFNLMGCRFRPPLGSLCRFQPFTALWSSKGNLRSWHFTLHSLGESPKENKTPGKMGAVGPLTCTRTARCLMDGQGLQPEVLLYGSGNPSGQQQRDFWSFSGTGTNMHSSQ